MKTTSLAEQDVQAVRATGRETRTELLRRSARADVTLRKTFVQAPRTADSRRGPLHEFVAGRDLRGLKAYLLIVAACSNAPDDWTTRHDSAVWARMMDIDRTATEQAARTGAWRTLRRLQKRSLIDCSRSGSSICVTLLREDGSGCRYERPLGTREEDLYLRIPSAFWTKGYDEQVDLPSLALLLVILRERDWSAFPAERAPQWYGWSADTHERGLKGLLELGLVERRQEFRKAPLAPSGFTMAYQYQRTAVLRARKRRKHASVGLDGTGEPTGPRASETAAARQGEATSPALPRENIRVSTTATATAE
ncbi:hypothetical protein ACH415_12125 [Streptomyces californicus]|uniref:hypothetical protein n=1 Tax=Streptomyces californicus TaxID=67351 RepID=UPI0037B62F62